MTRASGGRKLLWAGMTVAFLIPTVAALGVILFHSTFDRHAIEGVSESR